MVVAEKKEGWKGDVGGMAGPIAVPSPSAGALGPLALLGVFGPASVGLQGGNTEPNMHGKGVSREGVKNYS